MKRKQNNPQNTPPKKLHEVRRRFSELANLDTLVRSAFAKSHLLSNLPHPPPKVCSASSGSVVGTTTMVANQSHPPRAHPSSSSSNLPRPPPRGVGACRSGEEAASLARRVPRVRATVVPRARAPRGRPSLRARRVCGGPTPLAWPWSSAFLASRVVVVVVVVVFGALPDR